MIWVHNLNPFAIQFTESFGIRWYGLAYLAGLVIGYFITLRMTQKGRTLFKTEQLADYATYCAIGVLGGGRLGFCLFYSPQLLTSFDGDFPYWGVIKVNEGGMASHGGILGVLLVAYLYGKYHKIPWLHCLDVTALGASLGFFFGRIANFINGELYGREAPAGLAWAVKFPQEMGLWAQKDPSRLQSLKGTVDALRELKTSTGEVISIHSTQFAGWVESYGRDYASRLRVQEVIEAIIKAVQSGNTAVTEQLGLVLTPRYPSQLIQAVLEGGLVFLALLILWRRPQKPGVIGAAFGTLYCLARIVGEQFRMPDVGIGFQLWGLTRGQWLSLAMVLVAIAFWVWAATRPAAKIGGLVHEVNEHE